MIAYRATHDVSRELVLMVSRLLAAHRRELGTRQGTRALTCFWQAVLGLRWFRGHTDVPALGRDHGISRATAYRYPGEVIEVLAERAPGLQALRRARDDGLACVILDGKVRPPPVSAASRPPASRGEPIDAWYSGKAHRHGGNIQALLAPGGFPLWASDACPGSVHDLTAARACVLPALYPAAAAGLPALADPGYHGAGHGVLAPIKDPPRGDLDAGDRTYNALLRSLRFPSERGFSLLTGRWRALRHITASPGKISDIVKAALVLTHFEYGYLK